MTNFLIAFEATEERTEGLALALGLGVVQRGGNIRLRHLSAEESSHLAHRGYGRLQAADLEWADCLAVGIEAAEPNADLDALLQVVAEFRGALGGKKALVFGTESGGSAYVRNGLAGLGLSLLELPGGELSNGESSISELSGASMTAAGNRIAEAT